jgi:1,4-alpha-glucan branching enzyme
MQKRKGKEEGRATAEASRKNPNRKASAQDASLRSIVLAVLAPDAQSVSVVGEFNDWQTASHPLKQSDGETWQITLQLPPGTYQYKFVIDGTRWEDDADNPKRMMNEFGTSNSILDVP